MSNQYVFDRTRSMRKSIILWKGVNNEFTPVMYMTRPKNVSKAEFEELLNRMRISIFEYDVMVVPNQL
jgi:hypothetical protein